MKPVLRVLVAVTTALTLPCGAATSEFISEVVPVKYAKASDIAEALNRLDTGAGGSSNGGISRVTAPMDPTGARGGGATNRIQQLIERAASLGTLEFTSMPKVIADERSNSLLIFATKEELEEMKRIVSKLDVPVRQILIEAAVLEVRLPDSQSAGLQHPERQRLTAADCLPGGSVLWFTNLVPVATTNAAGSQPEGFSYVAGLGDGFDSLIAALCLDRQVNLIQRPRILTSSGTPGTIFVGYTIPYRIPPGYDPNAGSSHCSPALDTGLGLEITPVIKPDGLVVMDVQATVDKAAGTTRIPGVGDVPNTSHGKSQVTVAVREGDIVMIGGRVKTPKQKPSSGIPVLRSLFRGAAGRPRYVELAVLARLTVLPAPAANDRSQGNGHPR